MNDQRTTRFTTALCMLTLAVALFASDANAVERRIAEHTVTITKEQTIDDTLIAAGETVVIDGVITKDLFAFARRIIVRGSIGGNLIAFAEDITIQGQVGGMVIGAGASVDLINATVSGDLWGAGESVRIDPATRIAENAMIAARRAGIAGRIGHDALTFAEKLEVSGRVGRNLDVFARRVHLLNDARIGGDLSLLTDRDNALRQSANSAVGGEVNVHSSEMDYESRGRHVQGGYYLLQLFRLISAFIAGLVLLWCVPCLRTLNISNGTEGLKAVGIGLLTVIALPVFMLVSAVTLVGLPFTVIGFFLLLLVVYFAKILLASFIGRLLPGPFKRMDNYPLTLLSGLVVILLVVNIPWVGGFINLALTLAGAGLIVQQVRHFADNFKNQIK